MSRVDWEVKQFILPFSVLSENRKEPFTPDLEAAAVFSLAEMDRAKGGGFFSKRPEEKMVFIAKIGYPLWLFPWSETALIFDGMNRSKYTLPYAVVPDAKAFMENLKRGSKTRETHQAFLADHINYFQTPVTEKSIQINGLIREPEFLSEFDSYRAEATAVEVQPTNVALLSPAIDKSAIASAMQELERLSSSFKKDVESLNQCMKFINEATQHYIKTLRSQAKAIKEEFDVKINAQEELINPKVNRLKEQYDHQLIQSKKSADKERLPLQKTKVKLEKSKEHALAKIEQYKLEAKTCAEKANYVGEDKWKEKANETKKELSDIEDQLKEAEKTLEDFEERKSLEIFNLRSELENKTKEARQPLLDLESSRDAEVMLCEKEIEQLEQQTKVILDQVGRTVKLREVNIENFAKLGVKRDPALTGIALYYVPFYVACYEVDSKKRYLFLPPSEANAYGLTAKLKSALGRAKIKQLLVSRFELITSLMDTLQVLAQQNAVFETEMREVGAGKNILNNGPMRESIRKGLEYIMQEGWISEKEHQALIQIVS
jgi:uncharacterized protein YukE